MTQVGWIHTIKKCQKSRDTATLKETLKANNVHSLKANIVQYAQALNGSDDTAGGRTTQIINKNGGHLKGHSPVRETAIMSYN